MFWNDIEEIKHIVNAIRIEQVGLRIAPSSAFKKKEHQKEDESVNLEAVWSKICVIEDSLERIENSVAGKNSRDREAPRLSPASDCDFSGCAYEGCGCSEAKSPESEYSEGGQIIEHFIGMNIKIEDLAFRIRQMHEMMSGLEDLQDLIKEDGVLYAFDKRTREANQMFQEFKGLISMSRASFKASKEKSPKKKVGRPKKIAPI